MARPLFLTFIVKFAGLDSGLYCPLGISLQSGSIIVRFFDNLQLYVKVKKVSSIEIINTKYKTVNKAVANVLC